MSALDELTNLLPTRATTLIAGLTLLLVPAMFVAPHFLSPLMPEKTEAEIILLQLLAAVSTALACTLTVLALALREHYSKSKEFAVTLADEIAKARASKTPTLKAADDGRIEETKERILTFLSKHHDWVADPDIAAALEIDRALATFHLVELDSAGMIKTCFIGICFDDCPGRQIEQPGRAYLVSHGHL